MPFTEVEQQVACTPASEVAEACRESWADWQLEILVSLAGAPISILDAGPAGGGVADAGIAGSSGAAASGGALARPPLERTRGVASPDRDLATRGTPRGSFSCLRCVTERGV